jgi:hypothetical protein
MNKFLYVITLLFFVSCSSEKPVEMGGQKPSGARSGSSISEMSRAPVSSGSTLYSLEIVPANVTRNSTIYLVAQGFNLADAKIGWLVNDKITNNPAISQFNAAETEKGDRVQARAIVKGKEIFSNIIQIKNSPPEISKVKILPEVFKPGDTLSVEASGSDRDGDEVIISYEWTKNGEPDGNSKQIEVPLKRGDKVDIKITPFDGEAYGRPVVLHREIKNLPPMFVEYKQLGFEGKTYSCQVRATDADGDVLTYSLKSAPSGMTVDPLTGVIKWDVPLEFKGKTSFIVLVNDGHGGEATQSFNIEIKPETRQISSE